MACTSNFVLPVAADVCSPVFVPAQITQLLLTLSSAENLTDVSSGTEWNSRKSNTAVWGATTPKPIRQLYVRGSKPAASPTKQEVGGGKDTYSDPENTLTLTSFDMSANNQAIMKWIQQNKGASFKVWYVTGTPEGLQYLWGDNSGIITSVSASQLVNEARTDFIGYQINVTWTGIDPTGIPLPFVTD